MTSITGNTICPHGYNNDITNCPAVKNGICDIDNLQCEAIESNKEPLTDFQTIQQKYYEFAEIANDHFESLCPEITAYVKALEEREKRFIDFIAMLSEYEITDTCISDFIEEITGQSIEEVLKR